jgi:hypothetical protein
MSNRARAKDVPPPRGGRARAVILLGLAAVILGGGGAWWLWSKQNGVTAGMPRLAVDRTEIDLGYRRFDTAARVVFTLTNAGDGPLRLAEVPRVNAVQGC